MLDPANTLKSCLKDKDPLEWKGYTFYSFSDPEHHNYWDSPNTKVLQSMQEMGLVEVEPIAGRFRIADMNKVHEFLQSGL